MGLLLSTSVVASFIVGIAALFAPCCITVLLPSYFASIFRERRKVFLMTFIFFLGILTVFLPIGLGVAALGQIFSRYHNIIFGLGGIFLLALGIFLLLGRHFNFSFAPHPALKKNNVSSVYVLGIFSGIATTCCAPVFAGVLALASLPGTMLWGVIYTLSYVLGMVAPLFLISLFLDKVDFVPKLNKVFHRRIEYSIGKNKISVIASEAVSGVIFLAMGAIIIYLSLTNRLFVHSQLQTGFNIFLTKILSQINDFVKIIPEYFWALLLIIAVGVIIKITINQIKKYEQK